MVALRRVLLVILFVVLGMCPAALAHEFHPKLFQELSWRVIGPCGTHRRYRRRPSPAEYFLHGPKQRRCLEDNGLWEDLEPYLR